ncbi:katanin p60 ATPase-containing subunit A-like 2 [Culex quinquefasciatus]|uniref:katanin p60 ATPase-containing subunit A-like 2 n=1 Tax=Culex quinquefasciatus TaxID=7176 RepID=UPI0018E3CC42|nr:katanin p60 ATPase-containing subunit A-like 2 [Culex quinquefasciatus]
MSFEQDKRSLYERRRNILYLVSNYFSIMGLTQARQALLDETHLTEEFEVCDNIDLDTMYQEYCSYYQLKFGKAPRIVKKADSQPATAPVLPQRKQSGCKKRTQPKQTLSPRGEPEVDGEAKGLGNNLTVSQLVNPNQPVSPSKVMENGIGGMVPNLRPFIRLHENFSSDWKELADLICRDLIKKDLHQRWNQVKGLDMAVSLLKESVITPLQYPELFVGLAKPWRCILLHGPPGTGKTLLARTLCSETHESITFFNATASTLISKWRGESEKLVRVLYDVARFYAPSIIFIDEFDGLASRRDSVGEHEASKRFKNEFLSLIDGLDSSDEERVFLLASTNIPWEIDSAFLRRFEKKILIDVPAAEGRRAIFGELLPDTATWARERVDELCAMTEGFTGDEIRIACKEAAMMVVRDRIGKGGGPSSNGKSSPGTSTATAVQFDQLKSALRQIQPASVPLIEKHREWNRKFGNQS